MNQQPVSRSDRAMKRIAFFVFGLTVVLHLLWFALFSRNAPLAGDEPHYLMTTISLLEDGDVDLANNFRAEDYKRLGLGMLTPRHTDGSAKHMLPTDPWNYSLFLIPAWMIGEVDGVRLFTIMLTGLLAVSVFLNTVRLLHGRDYDAAIAALIICCSPPVLYYGSQVFPEIALTLFFSLSMGVLLSDCLTRASHPIMRGIPVGLLMMMHTRGYFLAAGIAMIAVLRSRHRWSWIARWMIVPVVVCSGLLFLTWLFTGRLTASPMSGRMPFTTGLQHALQAFGLFFDRESGLFALAVPYLLIAMFGTTRRPDPAGMTYWFAVPLVIYTGGVSMNPQWWGGWCPAGRYMIPFAPLAAIMLTAILIRCRPALKAFLLLLLMALIFLQIFPATQDFSVLYSRGTGINASASYYPWVFELTFMFPSVRAMEPTAGRLIVAWIIGMSCWILGSSRWFYPKLRGSILVICAGICIWLITGIAGEQSSRMAEWRRRLVDPLSHDPPDLLSPADQSKHFSKPPDFRWENVPGSDAYEFYLVIPNGVPFSCPVPGGNSWLNVPDSIWKAFPDGDYSWYVLPMRGHETGQPSIRLEFSKGPAASFADGERTFVQ